MQIVDYRKYNKSIAEESAPSTKSHVALYLTVNEQRQLRIHEMLQTCLGSAKPLFSSSSLDGTSKVVEITAFQLGRRDAVFSFLSFRPLP